MAVGPIGVPGQRWDTAPKPVDLDNSSMTGQDIARTQSKTKDKIYLQIQSFYINKDLSTKGSTAQDKLMKKPENPAIHKIVQVFFMT